MTLLFFLLKRLLIVAALSIPALLFLMLGALGSGGSEGGFVLFITAALCGLGWALLPLTQAGPLGGAVFGVGWLALATWHVADSPNESTTGAVLVCWVLASLFVALRLRAQPPSYFPARWRAMRRQRAGRMVGPDGRAARRRTGSG